MYILGRHYQRFFHHSHAALNLTRLFRHDLFLSAPALACNFVYVMQLSKGLAEARRCNKDVSVFGQLRLNRTQLSRFGGRCDIIINHYDRGHPHLGRRLAFHIPDSALQGSRAHVRSDNAGWKGWDIALCL